MSFRFGLARRGNAGARHARAAARGAPRAYTCMRRAIRGHAVVSITSEVTPRRSTLQLVHYGAVVSEYIDV
eukprot:COSAG02_NODE_1022_length_15153_cov_3.631460_24_plen_71_part_00